MFHTEASSKPFFKNLTPSFNACRPGQSPIQVTNAAGKLKS
jgi:hypothetical protein